MDTDTHQEGQPEAMPQSVETQSPAEQVSPDSPKPKFDVNAIYPHANQGILAQPEAPAVVGATTGLAPIATSSGSSPMIENVVMVVGALIALAAVGNLLQTSLWLFASSGRGIVIDGLLIVLSLFFISLGLGIMKKKESARQRYVLASLISLALVVMVAVPWGIYVGTMASKQASSQQAAAKIQQAQDKLNIQSEIVEQQARIASDNNRITSDQNEIAQYQSEKDSAALANNISSLKTDIEQEKIDIQRTQLSIQQLQISPQQPVQQSLWAQYATLAVTGLTGFVFLIGTLIFLTRKNVKAVFG